MSAVKNQLQSSLFCFSHFSTYKIVQQETGWETEIY